MIVRFLRRLGKCVLELLYPSTAQCLGCGNEQGCEHSFLCDDCLQMLMPSNVSAGRSEWRSRGVESISFVYYYGRPIRGLIRAFKFHGMRVLGDYMAEDMAKLLEMRGHEPYDTLIPIPLHPARLSERGFNQAEVLARLLSQKTGIPLDTKSVKRIRKTKQQSKLARNKRAKNLRNAFRVKGDFSGKRVLLIDDVITTGNTICSCAEALKAAGAVKVCAMSIAGTHYCHYGSSRRYRLRKER